MFLADPTVAMVAYFVTKIITTCLSMIRQFLDTMIVATKIEKLLFTKKDNWTRKLGKSTQHQLIKSGYNEWPIKI